MGIKSKIKFRVDLKNKKQIIIGILTLITIVLLCINIDWYLKEKKYFKQLDFMQSENLHKRILEDFKEVVVPESIYQEAQKDRSAYLQKIKKEKEDKIAKIANTRVLSLGKIRIEKAKELRYYCEKYGLEIPSDYQINGFHPESFDQFDIQVAENRVKWYTDFINSFGEKTKEQQETYDAILNEHNPIEKAEIDKLNAAEIKAEEVRAYKEKIAMGEKPSNDRNLGYYYSVTDNYGEMLIDQQDKELYSEYYILNLFEENKGYNFSRYSDKNFNGTYGIIDTTILNEMMEMIDGKNNVGITIKISDLENKNNPIGKMYKNFKSNSTGLEQPFYIMVIIISYIMSILGVLFYDKKIFKYYRKIKIKIIFLIIALSIWCIFVGGFYYWWFSKAFLNCFIILPIVIMFIVSDITYLIDNGFKNFRKERFGLIKILNFNNFIKSSKAFLRKSQKLKLAIFIITSIIYNLIAFKLYYRYGRGLLAIGQEMLIIYYVFLIIYLIYKLISTGIEVKEIEKATRNISRGQFNIEFKRTRTSSLDSIRENLSNIDKGFKIAIEDEIKSERMKSELITNVSHDLKTPLTSIINYVDLLQRDNLSEEDKKEYLKILDNKSKRLKILIEDLFEAAKATTGNIELNIEKINIVSVLRQTMGEFTEKIENEKLDFKVNIPDNKIILELDGARMWRVFENLIGNALKYSLKGTRVYIDLIETDKAVVFEIKNISGYELNCNVNELKERFKRADLSRNTEGSGLGLSIANGLVELQGGKLDISIDGDLFKVRVSFKK